VETHDLVPGGVVTYVLTGPDGAKSRGLWHVTSVEPPTWLEFIDGWANEDGTPNAAMPTTRAQVRLSEHEAGTRMELRFLFESREHMEQLEGWGAFDVLPQAVGQMDDVLTTIGGEEWERSTYTSS
jgi:uncharacterized protein YndB with AHSA1/START domain